MCFFFYLKNQGSRYGHIGVMLLTLSIFFNDIYSLILAFVVAFFCSLNSLKSLLSFFPLKYLHSYSAAISVVY